MTLHTWRVLFRYYQDSWLLSTNQLLLRESGLERRSVGLCNGTEERARDTTGPKRESLLGFSLLLFPEAHFRHARQTLDAAITSPTASATQERLQVLIPKIPTGSSAHNDQLVDCRRKEWLPWETHSWNVGWQFPEEPEWHGTDKTRDV